MTTATTYLKARDIVDVAEARGVLSEAKTYDDAEWREMATAAGFIAITASVISMCRTIVEERTSDPFRGL